VGEESIVKREERTGEENGMEIRGEFVVEA